MLGHPRTFRCSKGANVITVTADDVDESLDPAEVDAETVRLNTASATITVTVNEFLYFLAEGATGTFFDLDIAIANPNARGRAGRRHVPQGGRHDGAADADGAGAPVAPTIAVDSCRASRPRPSRPW